MIYTPDIYIPSQPVTLSYVDKGGEHCSVYQINPKHRNGDNEKSQWIITMKEEVHLFGWAFEWNSYDSGFYWGVIKDDDSCRILGRTVDKKESRIARFVGSKSNPVIWHGYPVDYITDPQYDCPKRQLLLKWAERGLITKSQISKLIRGQGWKG